MKKQFVVITISIALTSSSFAAVPFLPKFLKDKPQPAAAMKSHEGYANFSGQWIGTCDDDPDERQSLKIEQSSDFSSLTMNNLQIPIDAISTHGSKGNFEVEKGVFHLRWSSDGQQIAGSQIFYRKIGNLSQGGMETVVGKFNWSIENGQLIYNNAFSIFTDGTLTNTLTTRCVYDQSDVKN